MVEAVENKRPPAADGEEPLDIDFSDLEAKYATNPDSGMEAFVVVDGAPVVPESKVPILTKFLTKEFSKVGKIADNGFYMPMDDETKKTRGFLFVEYKNPNDAAKAITELHMKKIDKQHTLLVNKLSDVEKYAFEGKVSSEYKEPEIEPFKPRGHLRSWLTDPQGRDQLVLHRGDNVGVFWHRRNGPPEQIVDRTFWTEKYMRWSPKGTYLLSVHRQGVALWAGDNWERVGRFAHNDVRLVDFSPNEKYLVTWSGEPITVPPSDDPNRDKCPFQDHDQGNSIVVWDVRTQMPLRTFPMLPPPQSAGGPDGGPDKKIVWPMFKWSANSKYMARVVPGEAIQVYETPGMGLLDKKSIKIPGIVDFEFAPATIAREGVAKDKAADEQLLCYWTPEMANQTARVSLMSLPSREVIRSRNLFNVSGCRMHWQDQAKYLCVKVDRHTKTKKSTFTNLEFFHVSRKDTPVEVIELKETVVNFQWEPKSDRFVLISFLDQGTATAPPVSRNSVSFYALERAKGNEATWKLAKKIEKTGTNSIYWSPKGRFVCTVFMKPGSNSELEWWDMDHDAEKKENFDLPVNIHKVGASEDYGMTDFEWDPSGRYVATYSSAWRHAVDNGYKLWDFRGQLLRAEPTDKFKALIWRPRPDPLLSKTKRKEIAKNLKTYSLRFDEEDSMEASEASRLIITKRREALAAWREWREAMDARLQELGLPNEATLAAAEEDDEVIEEVREEILEEHEEEV